MAADSTNRDALGRPRKDLWAAKKTEVDLELPKMPKPVEAMPESKVLSDTGWTNTMRAFVDADTPMSEGFRRFLTFVHQQRAAGTKDADILVLGAKMVERYPEAVAGTTAEFARGMRAALQAFRSQVEDGQVALEARKAERTASAPEREEAKALRREAREAKAAVKAKEEARAKRAKARSGTGKGKPARRTPAARPKAARSLAKATPRGKPSKARSSGTGASQGKGKASLARAPKPHARATKTAAKRVAKRATKATGPAKPKTPRAAAAKRGKAAKTAKATKATKGTKGRR